MLEKNKFTPMIQQYLSIKETQKHALLFFRLGDFYELFFEDALIASKELGLTLTSRSCGENKKAEMCGVPHHSAEVYISKLIKKGFNVAVCEQTEIIKQENKSIVNREVVRIITPGTTIYDTLLDENKNNYIMCIYQDKNGFGISYCDISTGIFETSKIHIEEKSKLIDEIARISPKEILTNENFQEDEDILKIFDIKINKYYDWAFKNITAEESICKHFGILNLNCFEFCDDLLCVITCGALMEFLRQTQKNSIKHITTIKFINYNNHMALNMSSRKNLELTETIRGKDKKGSLIWVIDKTKTPMGSRLIRKWIENPLIIKEDIEKRLDAVEDLKNDLTKRTNLRILLNEISDIERTMSKIIYNSANARDIIKLKTSFAVLPKIKEILALYTSSSLLKEICANFNNLDEIYKIIDESILENDTPISIKEGNIIKSNFNDKLDKLRYAKENGTKWLLDLEKKEREKTNIKTLKINYNKIFGYCFEVTNSYKNLVPDYFIRKQTLSNCERYFTEELKEIEETVLTADEEIKVLENAIFIDIREQISSNIDIITFTTELVSIIDTLQSLAEVAYANNYIKPKITTDGIIDIKAGRHPVIEFLTPRKFIDNNTYLDKQLNRLSIITGPNMAGKSTYMRQVALIVLLAQTGSFVPADFCSIGIVDKIFTRVGASDDIATGQSTFMVEMSELANILKNSTENSLLILDEIGRGTSTLDGLSIAWSTVEHIAKKIHARTFFATHYHELSELEDGANGIKNYHMCVEENLDDIIFIRKVLSGYSDKSYGIYVAKIAGIDSNILNRATEILNLINNNKNNFTITSNNPPPIDYKTKKMNLKKYDILLNEIKACDKITFRELVREIKRLDQNYE